MESFRILGLFFRPVDESTLAFSRLRSIVEAQFHNEDPKRWKFLELDVSTDCVPTGLDLAKFDILLFSCFIWSERLVENMLRRAFIEGLPCVVILGGPSAEIVRERLQPWPVTAYIGEGEVFLANLLERYNADPCHFKITSEQYGKLVIQTEDTTPDLSKIPSLVRHFVGETASAYFESQRGCRFACTFCDCGGHSRTPRYFPIDRILNDIQIAVDCGIRFLSFTDPDFLSDPGRALRILQKTEQCGIDIEVEANLLSLTPELIAYTRSMSRLTLNIGIQSWDCEVLRRLHRVSRLDMVRDRLKLLCSTGRTNKLCLHLIYGLPGQTSVSAESSIFETLAYEPDAIYISKLQVLPGTHLWKFPKANGLRFSCEPPYYVIETNWLNQEELQHLDYLAKVLTAWDNTLGLKTLYDIMFFKRCSAECLLGCLMKIGLAPVSPRGIWELSTGDIEQIVCDLNPASPYLRDWIKFRALRNTKSISFVKPLYSIVPQTGTGFLRTIPERLYGMLSRYLLDDSSCPNSPSTMLASPLAYLRCGPVSIKATFEIAGFLFGAGGRLLDRIPLSSLLQTESRKIMDARRELVLKLVENNGMVYEN